MPEISNQVGTRLLFENDYVRIWDLRLAPGESTGLHRHDLDFAYVVIGGGTLQTRFADGSADPPRTMSDGDVRFRKAEETTVHEGVNLGEHDWRNLVIELKPPATGSRKAVDPLE